MWEIYRQSIIENEPSITGIVKDTKDHSILHFNGGGIMEYKSENTNRESRNRNNGWILGRIYFNKEDKRIMIKRPRGGFGNTMNFGNFLL